MASNSLKRHADAHNWLTQSQSKQPKTHSTSTTPAVPDHQKGGFSVPRCAHQPRTPLTSIPNGSSARAGTQLHMKQAITPYTPYTPSLQVRPAQNLPTPAGTSRISFAMSVSPLEPYKPAVLHQSHPDSKLCQNYHWVPYPLGLMPYDSWHRLHHRDSVVPFLPFRCPVCRQERIATMYMRKVFLVAERLSWDERMVSRPEKELNEELNWKVNYELGILDPFVEDPERPPGGKHSRHNRFHPYQNEHEMMLAMKLIFTTEDITEATWALWISAQLNLQSLTLQPEKPDTRTGAFASSSNKTEPATALADKSRPHTPDAIETIDLTDSPEPPSKSLHGRVQGVAATQHSLTKFNQVPTTTSRGSTGAVHYNSTPAFVGIGQAVFTERAPLTIEPECRIRSYKSLQDFYSLLDKIERTSYVSAVFLEAYAEKLRDDMCKDCWLRHNINFDLF